MSQSSVILATLLAGFVAYLALTGKLATYWALLAGGGSKASGTAGTPSGSGTASPAAAAGGTDFSALAGELAQAFDPSAFLAAGSNLAVLGPL